MNANWRPAEYIGLEYPKPNYVWREGLTCKIVLRILHILNNSSSLGSVRLFSSFSILLLTFFTGNTSKYL